MIRWLRDFVRLLYINMVLVRYGVDRVVLSHSAFYSLRYLRYLNPVAWFERRTDHRGESIRLALQTLGPIFVKFGQALSTRRDFIPDDIADELEKLVDQVPGYPGEQAQAIVEKALGRPIHEVFEHFDTEPMASASIAQVHKAVLFDGTEVAVKVLRPKIRRVIERDVRLMRLVARLVQRFYAEGYRLKPVAVVDEFEKTIIDELDLMREGANASQLRRNFSQSKQLYVPEVYWDVTADNVLVTELIHGIPITNIQALKSANADMKKLAEYGVEIFFTQVFRDSFFHADMHRGNIFVDTKDRKLPRYMAVDFGIMGVLSQKDQRYLAENFLAFFKRDYREVAQLHVSSGWVPPDTRVEDFESAIRAVCEPIFERPLSDISFGKLLLRLFQTASRFKMEVQPQLLLLQKTLLSVEGIGRQLYPQLDLWQTAMPFLEKWMKERIGLKALWNHTRDKAPLWAEKFPDMPEMVYKLLQMRTELSPRLSQPVAVSKPARRFPWGAMGIVLIGLAGLHGYLLSEPEHTRRLVEIGVGALGGLLVLLGWSHSRSAG